MSRSCEFEPAEEVEYLEKPDGTNVGGFPDQDHEDAEETADHREDKERDVGPLRPAGGAPRDSSGT